MENILSEALLMNLHQTLQNINRHFAPMCNVQVAQFSNNTNRASQPRHRLPCFTKSKSYCCCANKTLTEITAVPGLGTEKNMYAII